jgi:hypothetical protein
VKRKFLIVAPTYDENIGGHVVLHKLCHLLNERGVEAYLLPHIDTYSINSANFFKSLFKVAKQHLKLKLSSYRTNSYFFSPIVKSLPTNMNDPSWVVVYPEAVNGNPAGAKNVVRWLLHQPGFHTGEIFYGTGELHVKYNSAIHDFHFPGCTLAPHPLKIIHYPTDLYRPPTKSIERKGTAYCIRKGKGKTLVHDVSNSILIDGKSHAEVSRIFSEVERFISYDSLTAYSRFAVLSGCVSIVIPDQGVSADEWYPNTKDRWGIAYGLSDEAIAWAERTRHLVGGRIQEEEDGCQQDLTRFLKDVDDYF